MNRSSLITDPESLILESLILESPILESADPRIVYGSEDSVIRGFEDS
jgi:hypothetical protein